jgi:hypothetical protein
MFPFSSKTHFELCHLAIIPYLRALLYHTGMGWVAAVLFVVMQVRLGQRSGRAVASIYRSNCGIAFLGDAEGTLGGL